MSTQQAEILFICGSPRSHTSEALLRLLEQGARDVGARSRKFVLSKKHIDPCIGCGYCDKTGTCVLALNPSDDYLELLDALEHADALAVVSPLFFAGPPAQLKALYDRLQPFWARKYVLGQTPAPKRPAQIFILGGGGDAHGYEPMVTISRSALAVAGFTLEKVQNFIGFKHASDVPSLPTEQEASQMALGELAHLRKACALQQDFEQRALAAGGAFARFVGKTMAKQKLQAELEVIEAEMVELQSNALAGTVGSAPGAATDEPFGGVHIENQPVMIVNQVDSDFETLKQAARASKSSRTNQASLNAVIGEAVAALAEQNLAADESMDEFAGTPANEIAEMSLAGDAPVNEMLAGDDCSLNVGSAGKDTPSSESLFSDKASSSTSEK